MMRFEDDTLVVMRLSVQEKSQKVHIFGSAQTHTLSVSISYKVMHCVNDAARRQCMAMMELNAVEMFKQIEAEIKANAQI